MIGVIEIFFENDYGDGGGGADKKRFDPNDADCGDKKGYEKKTPIFFPTKFNAISHYAISQCSNQLPKTGIKYVIV